MIYEPCCLNMLYAMVYYMCISNCGFSFGLGVSSDSVKVSLRSGFTFNKFIFRENTTVDNLKYLEKMG